MPQAAHLPLPGFPIATLFTHTTTRRALRAALVSLVFVATIAGAAPSAHAWTRTQVRGAEADLKVIEGARAQLQLSVRLHIGGGWLSELELPGIPQDAEFDATEPATLIADTGETYPPTLVLRHGVWRVTFPGRRTAPWRGDYTLTLNYRSYLTSLGHPSDKTQRLQWTMPAWRNGIEAAKIRIDAPTGTVSADRVETGIAYSVTSEAHADRVAITHERTQLPRDTGWVVTFDIPRITLKRGSDAQTAPLATGRAPSSGPQPMPRPTWWPLGVLALALLKRWLVSNTASRRRLDALPLIRGLGTGVRTAAICLLGLTASLADEEHPLLAAGVTAAFVALSLVRSFEPPTHAALHWSCADHASFRRTFWSRLRASVAPHAWLDATTPIGALTLGSVAGGLWWIGQTGALDATSLVLVASLISPLWCSATRLHLPWEGETMARVLNAWRLRRAESLSPLLVAPPTLLVGRDEDGIDRDARMSLRQNSPRDGLQSLDLVVVTDARTLKRQVALLAQVAAGSAADARFAEIPVSARRGLSASVVHVIGADHILAALAPREVHHDDPRSNASEPGLEAA